MKAALSFHKHFQVYHHIYFMILLFVLSGKNELTALTSKQFQKSTKGLSCGT